MNIFYQINSYFTTTLNSFVIENNLEKTIGQMSDAPIFFLPIFLLSAWIFYSYKKSPMQGGDLEGAKKSNLLNIVYWIILAIIINLLIQSIVKIDRPESVVKAILDHIPDASFPSDHAAVSFAFLSWLFISGYKKIWYIFSIFVIIMNFSRVAWGIHWFFDIIAWAFVWISSSIFIFKYLKNTKFIINLNNFIIKILNYIKL